MSKPNIYEAFDRATANFSAVAILWNGESVARIVLKHGSSVTAYVQVWGVEMVKGRAGGGGYDRATAAIKDALRKLDLRDEVQISPPALTHARRVLDAFADAGSGATWTSALEHAGFVVALVI